ncbi:hypothetical protein D3C76_1237490 [compost metagenome]
MAGRSVAPGVSESPPNAVRSRMYSRPYTMSFVTFGKSKTMFGTSPMVAVTSPMNKPMLIWPEPSGARRTPATRIATKTVIMPEPLIFI